MKKAVAVLAMGTTLLASAAGIHFARLVTPQGSAVRRIVRMDD